VLQAAAPVHADAISLTTPAGLNPGDRFRFGFVTSGTISTATLTGPATDITTYDSFVTAQAGGATYNGLVVDWKAIGSTSTVDARDHVGGYGTNVPVYLVNGNRIADDLTTNAGGLWGGSLLGTYQFDVGIDGSVIGDYVWTGTYDDGTAYYPLGDSDVLYGNSRSNNQFLYYSDNGFEGNDYQMLGLSAELTVAAASVPEIDPNYVGSVVALVLGSLGLLERRRVRCADTLHAV
jgi:hypothetical protein